MKASLFALPRTVATAKPAPYSNAITAGSDSSALARSALSLSKTGSPRPGGTPDGHQLADAADRVLVLAHLLDQRDHPRRPPPGSGQRTGVASTCSSVTAVGSGTSATTSPTCLT